MDHGLKSMTGHVRFCGNLCGKLDGAAGALSKGLAWVGFLGILWYVCMHTSTEATRGLTIYRLFAGPLYERYESEVL